MTFSIHSGPAAPQGGALRTDFSPTVGAVIYDQSGQTHRLGRQLGQGGEGVVFEISDKLVAKFYHGSHARQDTLRKLQLMRQGGNPAGQSICWPESLAVMNTTPRKWLGGFLMPRAHGRPLQHLLLKPVLTRQGWTRRHLVELALAVLEPVESLHAAGILLGDINLLNIFVRDDASVQFVDADSFQIGPYACPVGKLPFIRPCRVASSFDFSKTLREPEDDLFAVAVLIFMILLPGKPPYAHQGGGDVLANTARPHFPYPWGRNRPEGMPEGPWSFVWSHLTEKLKTQFGQTFSEGNLFPLADWRQLLEQYRWAIDQGHSSNALFPTTVKEADAAAIVARGGTQLTCRMRGCRRTFGVRPGAKLLYQICPQCRAKRYQRKCPLCGAGFFVSATQVWRAEENKWNLFCPACWSNRPSVTTRDGRTFQPSPQQEFDYKFRTGKIKIFA